MVAQGLDLTFACTASARRSVAHREVWPVQANWKLTVENFLECYHCKPAHPQYCGVEIKADKIGDGSPAAHGAL